MTAKGTQNNGAAHYTVLLGIATDEQPFCNLWACEWSCRSSTARTDASGVQTISYIYKGY